MLVFKPKKRLSDVGNYFLTLESDNPTEDNEVFNAYAESLIAAINRLKGETSADNLTR